MLKKYQQNIRNIKYIGRSEQNLLRNGDTQMTGTGIKNLIVIIYDQIKNAKFSPHMRASNTYRSAKFNTTEHLNISETVKQ